MPGQYYKLQNSSYFFVKIAVKMWLVKYVNVNLAGAWPEHHLMSSRHAETHYSVTLLECLSKYNHIMWYLKQDLISVLYCNIMWCPSVLQLLYSYYSVRHLGPINPFYSKIQCQLNQISIFFKQQATMSALNQNTHSLPPSVIYWRR